jgi:hypothetical protein
MSANDADLAAAFWDEVLAPRSVAGIPQDGADFLRVCYIRDAQASPEAMRQIRKWADERQQ